MTVRELLVGRQHIRVSGVGYSPEGQFSPNPNGLERQSDIKALLSAAALCNNARLSPRTPEKPLWSSLGDQTEAALKVASMKFGLFETRLEEEYPRLHELPFDARRKRMATIHKITANATNGTYPEPGSGKTPTDLPDATEIALVKGAPREVLHLCTHILLNGVVQDLDDEIRNEVITTNDDYARRALRVLALAYRNLPAHSRPYTVEKVEDDLVFLGLMAMMDPPRPEVSQTVLACRQAGIRLVMITGDYGLTAESMARRIGLLETPTPRIFTGAEMDTITDHDLLEIIKGETIYARMAPEHKLRLVDAFQRIGEVVAVTGDGVNDAPALRKADVGIVMGVTGTDVAKEAADLVITNDNFYSIIAAIEEGRGVFDNLRKFITYIFSSNVPEILPFILAGLLDIPPALTVLQILAIDLGTDLLPALALGAEHPAAGLLQLPPRKRGHPIIDRSLLKRAFLWLGPAEFLLSYTGFFAVYLLSGSLQLERLSDLKAVLQQLWSAPAWVHATTVLVYFAGVLMSQVGNVFAIRFESQNGRLRGWLSNPFLRAGIGIEVFLFIALALYNHSSEHPLGILFWIAIAFFSVILYGMDWFGKRFVSIRKRK
jgi:magnesium-transporting ATPase (P-type)